jgi:hypothetical protein
MPAHLDITARALEIVFLIGVTGCALAIPIIAWKFASVLFERNADEADVQDSAGKEHAGAMLDGVEVNDFTSQMDDEIDQP